MHMLIAISIILCKYNVQGFKQIGLRWEKQKQRMQLFLFLLLDKL